MMESKYDNGNGVVSFRTTIEPWEEFFEPLCPDPHPMINARIYIGNQAVQAMDTLQAQYDVSAKALKAIKAKLAKELKKKNGLQAEKSL